MTDKALTTFDPNADYAKLAAMIGQEQNVGPSGPPTLFINGEAEDEDGNRLPLGAWVLRVDGDLVYAKEVLFRPFLNAYRYRIWDAGERKWANQSTISTSLMVDMPDEKGGNKCGKLPKKVRDTLPKEMQEAQKKIRLYRLVYGVATMDGAKADGTVVKLENVPCIFKTVGGSFMLFDEVLEPLKKAKLLMVNHLFTLFSKREKGDDGKIHYYPMCSVDTTTSIPFGEAELATYQTFTDIIKDENDRVLGRYRAAISGAAAAKRDDDLDEDTLDGDFMELPPEGD